MLLKMRTFLQGSRLSLLTLFLLLLLQFFCVLAVNPGSQAGSSKSHVTTLISLKNLDRVPAYHPNSLARRAEVPQLTIIVDYITSSSVDPTSTKASANHTLVERLWAELFTFAWSATRVIVGNTWYGAALSLAGLACNAGGFGNWLPSWTKYPCIAMGFVGPFANIWTGRGDIASAWSRFRNGGSVQISDWELSEWMVYGEAATRSTADWHADWEAHLDQMAIDNWMQGKGLSLHDRDDGFALLSWRHLRGATKQKPFNVATSFNNTLYTWDTDFYFAPMNKSFSLGAVHRPMHVAYSPSAQASVRRDLVKRQGNCGSSGAEWVGLNDNGGYWTCRTQNSDTEPWTTYETNAWPNEGQFDAVDSDIGGEYAYNNGLSDLAAEISNSAGDSNWKRSCLEVYSSGNQIANGFWQIGPDSDHDNGLGDC